MDDIEDIGSSAPEETSSEQVGTIREALENLIPENFDDEDSVETTDETSDEKTDIEEKIDTDEKIDAKEEATIDSLPETLREEITLNNSIADSFKDMIEPHWNHIQEIGVNPYEHVNQLLDLSKTLFSGTPQAKAELVANLYKNFGVDFDLLDEAIVRVDTKPTVEQSILQKLDKLERQIAQPQRQAPAQNEPSVPEATPEMIREVEQFAATHPYFERLQADIGLLLQAGRASSLEDAYNKAIRLNDDVQAELKTKNQNAATAGRTQVKSSGSPSKTASSPAKLTLRESIARAYDANR